MILLRNKVVTLIVFVYSILLLSVINWGNPNLQHPYNYHMDEWHQFMSVKAVYEHGTPNFEGAAHGPLFQFLLSGVYLIPFILFGVIHPSQLKESLLEQNTLFYLFRANTLLFGIFSLLLIAKTAKDYLKVPPFLPVLFFAATPIWLSLSNYFKYDIALLFWILLAFYFMLQFYATQKRRSYLFAGIATGLALATKISALPLVLLFIFSFFFFIQQKDRQNKTVLFGVLAFVVTFLFIGIPDVLLGIAHYGNFFSSNLQDVPSESTNLILGESYWRYLFVDQYVLIFGHFFYPLSLIAISYWIVYYVSDVKRILQDKVPFFFLISLCLFVVSLLPLKLFATGNRSLVLLPFLVFLGAMFLIRLYKELPQQTKYFFIGTMIILFFLQIFESIAWVSLKWHSDPRQTSSQWLEQHVPKGSSIGIEMIPIYQYLPDIVVKEYYAKSKKENKYRYTVFEKTFKTYPDYVLVTNYDILTTYFKQTPSRGLVKELKNHGYQRVAEFYPDQLSIAIFHDPLGFYLSNIVPMRSVWIYQK
jgi:hypothetical protein